jgi:hypothetical protein
MVTLALAVMVAYGLAWGVRKLQATNQRRAAAFTVGVLLLTLVEHLSVPLPLSNFQIPGIYQTIARDPGEFSVLEIPLAWRNGFRLTGTIDQEMMFEQWYQTEQEHPILGGNTSRNPELKFQYFTEAPVLNSLIAVETGHTLDAATLDKDQALAPAVLRFFEVRYVVWHTPRDSQNLAALKAARAYAESVFPMTEISDVVDDSGETAAYRVNDGSAEAKSVMIHPDDPLARLHFAEGWGAIGQPLVWATRNQARLFLHLDSIADETLAFQMSAPMPNQRVTLTVNGTSAGALALQPGSGNYSRLVPREAWRPGMNEIDLAFSELAPVGSAHLGDYAIGTTGTTSPVSLVVRSAGSEVGDFAHIYVDGVDAAADTRGYNIVVVDPGTGAVEGSEAFDTFASPAESARLAQYISGIQNGKIVVVAARDTVDRPDTPGYLSAAAVDALRSVGAGQDLRTKFRWSHAIIGVKGAAPGTALEAASETWPAQLVAGVGAMEPNVAAALQSLSVTPK